MSETRLREAICRFGRSLFERGLTPGSSGNISVRTEDGGWTDVRTDFIVWSLLPEDLEGASGSLADTGEFTTLTDWS